MPERATKKRRARRKRNEAYDVVGAVLDGYSKETEGGQYHNGGRRKETERRRTTDEITSEVRLCLQGDVVRQSGVVRVPAATRKIWKWGNGK